MENKNKLVLNRLEIIGFLAYFLVLAVERLLALIFSVRLGGVYAITSGNAFNYIAYGVTAASLVAGAALSIKPSAEMIKSLISGEIFDFEARSKGVMIGGAALLFGGMMHTGFTLAPVQFVSYGFLIGAMIVRAVEFSGEGKDTFLAVSSAVYLTLFAMAIPVCYISFMGMPLRITFFCLEFAAVFALVPCFFIMLFGFMKTGTDAFRLGYPALLLLLSGAVVALKWREEINFFVLIFLGLTVIFYLTFGLVARRKLRAEK